MDSMVMASYAAHDERGTFAGDGAEVMYGERVYPGDRVRHYGQRYPGAYSDGTATVVGVKRDLEGYPKDWVKITVEPDGTPFLCGNDWDWDRTVKTPKWDF